MSIEDKLYKFLGLYKQLPDSVKKVIVAPFKVLPRKFYMGKKYELVTKEIEEFYKLSEAERTKYQFSKMKEMLDHAYKTVPFYRWYYKEHGLDLNEINSFSDFELKVPFIDRELVQKYNREFVSDKYNESQHLIMNTGGSTGLPLKLYYLKGDTRAKEWAHVHYLWRQIGVNENSRYSNLRGEFIGKDRTHSFDPWRNLLMLSSFNLNKNNALEYLELLKKYKVEYLNAYPSSILNLINLSKFKNFNCQFLKGILLSSENVYEWQVDRIKEFFGVDVFNLYGHGELCLMGGNCKNSLNYHMIPTFGYLEFYKDKESELHEMVGTTLVNPLMPLIRYKTGDMAIPMLDRCSCGIQGQSIKKIIGRKQELAVGKNGEEITLTALIFGRHSEFFNHVEKIQVVNERPGILKVKVVPKNTFKTEHREEIIRSLSHEEGMPFETSVIIEQDICSTKRGKHRFLIREF